MCVCARGGGGGVTNIFNKLIAGCWMGGGDQ